MSVNATSQALTSDHFSL